MCEAAGSISEAERVGAGPADKADEKAEADEADELDDESCDAAAAANATAVMRRRTDEPVDDEDAADEPRRCSFRASGGGSSKLSNADEEEDDDDAAAVADAAEGDAGGQACECACGDVSGDGPGVLVGDANTSLPSSSSSSWPPPPPSSLTNAETVPSTRRNADRPIDADADATEEDAPDGALPWRRVSHNVSASAHTCMAVTPSAKRSWPNSKSFITSLASGSGSKDAAESPE